MFLFCKKRKEARLQESRKKIIILVDNDLNQCLLDKRCFSLGFNLTKISDLLRVINYSQESAECLIQTIKKSIANINIATEDSVKKVAENEINLLLQIVSSLNSNDNVGKIINVAQCERIKTDETNYQIANELELNNQIEKCLIDIGELESKQNVLIKKAIGATATQKSIYKVQYSIFCEKIKEKLKEVDIYSSQLSNNAKAQDLKDRINAYDIAKRYSICDPALFSERLKEYEDKKEEQDNIKEDIDKMLKNSSFYSERTEDKNTEFDARVESEKSKVENGNFSRITDSIFGDEKREEKQ